MLILVILLRLFCPYCIVALTSEYFGLQRLQRAVELRAISTSCRGLL